MRFFLSNRLSATMTLSVWLSAQHSAMACFISKAVSSTTVSHYMTSAPMDTPVLSLGTMDIFHLQRAVDSTQDEAKRLIDIRRPKGYFAVIAENQRKGRGTSGRKWVATEGNLFLTLAIPTDAIPRYKTTLLPLGVGLVIAQIVRHRLTIRPTVKWPNDVLIDGQKVAGTLIENHVSDNREFFLVGVGVNVRSHPVELPSEGGDFRSKPRSATHLQNYANPNQGTLCAFDIGVDIAAGIQDWVSGMEYLDPATFTSDWRSWADLKADYELRKTGEKVKILDVEQNGLLRVIDGAGKERFLAGDYFF